MISNRMLTNVSFVKEGARVADIACDHGLVAIYLIEQGIASKVCAMDIAEGPLEHAHNNIRDRGLADKIDVRLSDGLQKLKVDADGIPEVDTIIAGGIGGRLAVKIIEDSLDVALRLKSVILQPQSEIDFVRIRMSELGFLLKDEKMTLEEGKFYTTLLYEPRDPVEAGPEQGKEAYSEVELIYGPCLIRKKDPVLLDYLKIEYDKFVTIRDIMKRDNKDSTEGLKKIEQKIQNIEEAMGLWNGGSYGKDYN
ncbi:MAG: class I SAM-dependent methyltransferase [Lachnospiraceae bacterium]|nr:class I SAM-dependent methyltransferase [Lachnospiraceae bacterium]